MRALAVIAAIGALAVLIGAAEAGAAAPQRMQVTQDEWSLVLSRQVLRAGPALIEVFNIGQDGHDLVMLRKTAGAKSVRVKKLDHFMRAELNVRLAKGTYTLWCSLPNHRKRGMVATLRVR